MNHTQRDLLWRFALWFAGEWANYCAFHNKESARAALAWYNRLNDADDAG